MTIREKPKEAKTQIASELHDDFNRARRPVLINAARELADFAARRLRFNLA